MSVKRITLSPREQMKWGTLFILIGIIIVILRSVFWTHASRDPLYIALLAIIYGMIQILIGGFKLGRLTSLNEQAIDKIVEDAGTICPNCKSNLVLEPNELAQKECICPMCNTVIRL